ncbi:recombinase family protein [Embleya sp. NPDC059259]|uniref:zinc finger domain-containing protein n=1 Tax=unclassified Embleya TaxID=2699296 RepID=UPI0036A6622B
MEWTPDRAADAVERHDCPKCAAPAGSPCRTRASRTAVKYHTPRFVLVPALRELLDVPTPADRRPGKGWIERPAPAPVAAGQPRPIRIGYARTSLRRQELASQIEALEKAGCSKIFREQISTRIKVRPELEKALQLAHRFKEAAPDQDVLLTVHELKRLPHRPAHRGVRPVRHGRHALRGPGGGRPARPRLHPGETLEGQDVAAAKGRHGGRPKVVDDDMLVFALALRDKGVPVPDIAAKLVIRTGRNAGRPPSLASVYRALAQADETAPTPDAVVPRQSPPEYGQSPPGHPDPRRTRE